MTTHETTSVRSVILGSLCTVLAAFPIAGFLGLVWRFPVPFRGIDSGLDHVIPSLFAVLFYGVIGGSRFSLLPAQSRAGWHTRSGMPTSKPCIV